jgi:membrane protein implicated in regulation of membrane protease activity
MGQRPGLAVTVALYALARLALIAVVAGLLLAAGVPFLIALLVGLIVALPLSMVLFRGLRGRLDSALAEVRQRRSAERSALRARLRGEAAPASDEPSQREPDPGQG